MDRTKRNIGFISAWAFAYECACGWGAFMMPQTTFLPKAGPLGAIIGILLASLSALFIGINISHMAEHYPKDAGVHIYIEKIFGHDHGFLAAWAMLLAYLSVLWANATAIVLLIRYVSGDVLQFGFHYSVAGYDVWCGEILLTVALIIGIGLLALVGNQWMEHVHRIMAFLNILLVAGLFIVLLVVGQKTVPRTFGFGDNSYSPGVEVFNIMMMTPWMFVGIEAVTYMLNSGGRHTGHLGKAIVLAVIAGFLNYLLLALIPVVSLPAGYEDWSAYLSDANTATGLFSLPVFYSVYTALGNEGLYLLVVCIVCAITTTIYGLYRATSRLLSSMVKADLMPKFVERTNRYGEPYVAILMIMAVSIVVPFFGRTAIGSMVDITTITATIVYVYAAAGSFRLARKGETGKKGIHIIASVGMLVSVLPLLFLLIPNIFSQNQLATESYFILAIWGLLGLIYYWYVYRSDKKHISGTSTVMWMMMIFLIFFSVVMWTRQRSMDKTAALDSAGIRYFSNLYTSNALIQMTVVFVILILMFSLFSTMLKRQRETDKKAIESEARNRAKTAFLFNMSHDIRTPMNAILGFTDLALLDTGNREKMDDYLKKIKSSGSHLLSLINDVLEMSRIESGKIELSLEPVNLRELMVNLDSIMRGQAEARGQTLEVTVDEALQPYVYTDRLRLNQVLLNLASNAIKYTQENGEIRISVTETKKEENRIFCRFSVKDNGMGMTPEFAAKVFEAFERDKDAEAKGIQGTGLGMAITRRIVDLMNGEISVVTEKDKGSEFLVDLGFTPVAESEIKELEEKAQSPAEVDFSGKRALLTDDVDMNREIGEAILEMMGLDVELATDGREAVEMVLSHPAGYYDVVLMDIQMPKLNGYDATKTIRSFAEKNKANVPIIAMTANAFEEDIKNAKAAGMNGHVAKPIDQDQLVCELGLVLAKQN